MEENEINLKPKRIGANIEYDVFPCSRFVVMVDESLGWKRVIIKWSIPDAFSDRDDYYMIDSLNPLRIVGGTAPIFERNIWTINAFDDKEYQDIINYVENLDSQKIIELSSQAILFKYQDKHKLSTPPGQEIVLWKPSKEDLEFRDECLKILYNCAPKAFSKAKSYKDLIIN